ncbi:twin-arginine translocase TatA/TatE family subunit [Selenomonas sp. ND2010]|uniref:Sec-independent protein translocase subunit TatA/TatB n=1 Tax=Selenomonas sp. ND2010 TaxID=1410618 RepID=UPI00350FC0F3
MIMLSAPELIMILVVGLVVFGPGKLPELARSLGKGVREFKKATNALSQAINAPEQAPVQQQATVQPQAPKPAPTAPETPVSSEAVATETAKPAAPAYQAPTQESVRQQIQDQAGKKAE